MACDLPDSFRPRRFGVDHEEASDCSSSSGGFGCSVRWQRHGVEQQLVERWFDGAGVVGFGVFGATDSGAALGAAGATAGHGSSSSISYTDHTNTSQVGGFGFGGAQAGGTSGANAGSIGWTYHH